MPELSIVVVSYNTRQMTLEAIRSVYRETKTDFEMIVVDNASTDGSAKSIAETFPANTYPNLKLIPEKVNHGFARAHDVAIPQSRGRWLLLLNPDTVVLDRAIDKLLRFAKQHPEAGIWGGRTLDGQGNLFGSSCWGRITIWSLISYAIGLTRVFRNSSFFNPEAYGGWKRDSERDVDIVSGCFFLIERATWDSLGGFDPTFVMYGEEADLCHRAIEAGFQPRITPDATIIHYGGASETVRADKVIRVTRARVELIKRHLPRAQVRIAVWIVRITPLLRLASLGPIQILGNLRYKRKFDIWKEIWERREEWASGFTNPNGRLEP